MFQKGGPYNDLYNKPSIYAKKDLRIKQSGHLQHFIFNGQVWSLHDGFLFLVIPKWIAAKY